MKTIFAIIFLFQLNSTAIIHVGLVNLLTPGLFPPKLSELSEFRESNSPQLKKKNNISKMDVFDTSLEVCDYERGIGLSSTDGIASFNLLLAFPANSFNISFYESSEDLNNGVEINSPESYRNTTAFNQTILASRMIGNSNEVIEEVNLIVIPIPEEPVFIGEYYVCNSNTGGGSPTANYDFEQIGQSIFGAEEVTFHGNLDEAFENDENFSFGDVLAQEFIVYIRKKNSCDAIYSLSLKILDKPQIELDNDYKICNNGSINLSLPSENLTYEWFKEDELNPFSLNSNAEISQAGTYSVIATQSFNINNDLYECSTEKIFSVEVLNTPEIETIEVRQGSENQILVQMEEPGNYEYSTSYLNNNYQDSNLFENAPAGQHEIYVREKNGCGIAVNEISILGFPKFFTPNNDSYNDLWQVDGFGSGNLFDKVEIYDRFGKLLKVLTMESKGWDGNFNGRPMPANDYWYKVFTASGDLIIGHFTLKR